MQHVDMNQGSQSLQKCAADCLLRLVFTGQEETTMREASVLCTNNLKIVRSSSRDDEFRFLATS
jgi:hypothetical protein